MRERRRVLLDSVFDALSLSALAVALIVVVYEFVYGAGGGILSKDGLYRTVRQLLSTETAGLLFFGSIGVWIIVQIIRPSQRVGPRRLG